MKPINQKASVKCQSKIIINANSVAVWKELSDIPNWPLWQPDIKMTQLNGDLRENTQFSWKSGGWKIHSVLHSVEPYTLLGWYGKSFGITAIHNWRITELKSQTEVAVEESMEGIFAWMFSSMLNKKLEKGMNRWLESLKTRCETRNPPV